MLNTEVCTYIFCLLICCNMTRNHRFVSCFLAFIAIPKAKSMAGHVLGTIRMTLDMYLLRQLVTYVVVSTEVNT